jgi:hypothetical protein
MRRISFVFVFVLLVSMLSAGKADAGFEWCSEDPVFVVNGNVVDITTRFLARYKNQIKPPVVIELLVPKNAIAAVLTVSGSVPVEGKVTKSLPYWSGLTNMEVVARVTVNATKSFEHYSRATGTGGWLTTEWKGYTNKVATKKFYLLLP